MTGLARILPSSKGQWAITRWVTYRTPHSRCGALSFIRPFLGHEAGYGYPNNGTTGALVLFETQALAQQRIDAGDFESPNSRHVADRLDSLTFLAEGGPVVLGPRAFTFKGSYEECVRACGLASVTGIGELKITEELKCPTTKLQAQSQG